MNADQNNCAQNCLDAAEANAMTFPEIVAKLIEAGFESYAIDFRRSTAIYYLPSGESIELGFPADDVPVEASFDDDALRAAILEAQTLAPGYTYKGFRLKAKRAGCAGYLVSFLGHRAVYFGRTGDTHVERFPQ
ncbi:hypothetical protein K9B33_19810 [Sphingobium sp. 3R8]|uniref:hypothetical protein n=1 Tax=Sphingobium sp. 3R8 TaxID=2874921 RepID=UPI001CCB0A5A|nr:hypothetical protein [Sphingobium sp. 3R8]MBZ9649788.1 hypothetical protein [Sphingobium sp. 3R8]